MESNPERDSTALASASNSMQVQPFSRATSIGRRSVGAASQASMHGSAHGFRPSFSSKANAPSSGNHASSKRNLLGRKQGPGRASIAPSAHSNHVGSSFGHGTESSSSWHGNARSGAGSNASAGSDAKRSMSAASALHSSQLLGPSDASTAFQSKKIVIVALRDIRRGEEITYDYKFSFFFTRQAQDAVAAAEAEVKERLEIRGLLPSGSPKLQ